MPSGPPTAAALAFTLIVSGCRREAPGGQQPPVAFDPYHSPPADPLEPATYEGWKQYQLVCMRCHGETGQGSTFGPDLLAALRPAGRVPNHDAFVALLLTGRPDRGMPPAARLGLAPEHFDGLYAYLEGRSAGPLYGGRPALRNP